MKKILAISLIFLSLSAFSEYLTNAEIQTNDIKMTEVQFTEYAKTLPGQIISWEGEVDEVETYFPYFSLFPPRIPYRIEVDIPASHVDAYITGVDKKVAMSLIKGSTIKFTGKIKKLKFTMFGYPYVVVGDAIIVRKYK